MTGRMVKAGGCGGWACCQGMRRTACSPAPRCAAGPEAQAALTKQLCTPARLGLRMALREQHCIRQRSRRRLLCKASDASQSPEIRRYVSPQQRWRQFKQDVRDNAVLALERFMCAGLSASQLSANAHAVIADFTPVRELF